MAGSASQIQGTRSPAVVGASAPVASRARARKLATLSAAGLSPSRKSLRSDTSGTRGGSGSPSFARTACNLDNYLGSPALLMIKDGQLTQKPPF